MLSYPDEIGQMSTDTIEDLLTAALPLIDLAIREDIGPGDATSESTLTPETRLVCLITAKASGVIAVLPIAEAAFQRVDPSVLFTAHVADGQEVVPEELIAEVTGPGRALLSAERTAINFLQRLSGIATLTRRYVDAVATTDARILDTRKTAPGFRVLDKYAVRMGGGENHRMSLFDMLLVKDNHIVAAGGITKAASRARKTYPNLAIEVEVRTLAQLREALTIEPPLDRILLDNMDLATMRETVALAAGRVPLEASGNVTLDNVAKIAATGVDFVSVGALTHSAPAFDLSMTVTTAKPQRGSSDLVARIRAAKRILGKRLIVLGHHYQRDEVLALADIRGDSLELARKARETDAEFIVLCGVQFMAEVAAVLAKPGQHVFLPDPSAGCYLADTARLGAVQAAWDTLDAVFSSSAETEILPITYINSSVDLKAFCGRHGGVVCTSSNTEKIMKWALAERPRAFFFPDQHLGRNTAVRMGFSQREILLWNLQQPPPRQDIEESKVILWPGACNVHKRFHPEHVHATRAKRPAVRILVHPECSGDVVDLADEVGSTAQIARRVETAAAGTQWAIGTEGRFVGRLQHEHPAQTILPLAAPPPFCASMTRTTLYKLACVLESLQRGELTGEVAVSAEIGRWASVAVERMLALSRRPAP